MISHNKEIKVIKMIDSKVRGTLSANDVAKWVLLLILKIKKYILCTAL